MVKKKKVRGKTKLSTNPVDIAIRHKLKAIDKLRQRKADARAYAEEDCRKIEKLIARQQILLAALKNGRLKP